MQILSITQRHAGGKTTYTATCLNPIGKKVKKHLVVDGSRKLVDQIHEDMKELEALVRGSEKPANES